MRGLTTPPSIARCTDLVGFDGRGRAPYRHATMGADLYRVAVISKRATTASPDLELDLGSEFHDTIRGKSELAGGALRISHHRGEQTFAPPTHFARSPSRNKRLAAQKVGRSQWLEKAGGSRSGGQ